MYICTHHTTHNIMIECLTWHGLRKFGNVALLYKYFFVVVIFIFFFVVVCASIQCPTDVDDDSHDDDESISSSYTYKKYIFLKFILAIIKSK